MVRDVYDELRAAGLIVAGISPNDEKTHRRFKKQHFLDQTLLADAEKDVIRMFGVDGPFGIGVRRATFLIDPNRQILGTLRADLRLARHEEFLRRAMLVRSILRKDPQPETVTRTRLR